MIRLFKDKPILPSWWDGRGETAEKVEQKLEVIQKV
jgi:hypothetical protein